MAKDPFANIPNIPPEEQHEEFDAFAEDHANADDELKRGGTSKNLLKNLSKLMVPALAIGVVAWLFMPDTGRPRAKVDAPKVEVDAIKQEADSDALLARMKRDASTIKPIIQASTPDRSSAAATGSPLPNSPLPNSPLPTPIYGGARAGNPVALSSDEIEAARKTAVEQDKRIEEIRSSSLEASTVKLGGDDDSQKPRSAVSDLQSELARVNTLQAEADREGRQIQERTAAALAHVGQPGANKRNSNQQFLIDAKADVAPAMQRQNAPVSNYVINEGAIIRTVLVSGVTSDLPGKIKARVVSDVYDSNLTTILIPKGSEIVGVYNSEVAVGQERILMAMNRLILPNGTWISLNGASASDMIGRSGMQAEVNNHFFKMFSSSLIIGGASLLLPKADTTITTSPTLGGGTQTAGTTFGVALNDVLKTILERNRNIGPTLDLKPGQMFTFMAAQDLVMAPYRQ